MGLTGLSYAEYMRNAGLPVGIIVWGVTFFMACRNQKRTEGKECYSADEAGQASFAVTDSCKRGTTAFLAVMAIMLAYGIYAGAGASYAIVVVLAAAMATGIAAGLRVTGTLQTMVTGSAKMYSMFFMFLLLDPFLNYISASGAFDAIVGYLSPLIDAGGPAVFLILAAAIGVFGISGAGVAQAQIIHDLFLPTVLLLQVDMGIWALVVLIGSQITFFAMPSGDMVANMGMAHCADMKPMMKNGWVITALIFLYLIGRVLFWQFV